jgi:hypothetical protein
MMGSRVIELNSSMADLKNGKPHLIDQNGCEEEVCRY